MSITCVTGYWNVKNKHGDNKYLSWFNNTLSINNPYIIFSDKEGIEIIKKYRKDLPTHYIELDIKDFYMQKYKDNITTNHHSPSVEVNMIWNEKIFMIQKASKLNPFNSDYFYWIDAGLCVYREIKPPSCEFSKDKIQSLPTDKLIYSQSNKYIESNVTKTLYYHHISGTYILHKNIIEKFVNLYKLYLDKLMNKNNTWTEQVILTHIYKDHKEIFYKLCDGYGTIIEKLF